jgi:hypothetical protein
MASQSRVKSLNALTRSPVLLGFRRLAAGSRDWGRRLGPSRSRSPRSISDNFVDGTLVSEINPLEAIGDLSNLDSGTPCGLPRLVPPLSRFARSQILVRQSEMCSEVGGADGFAVTDEITESSDIRAYVGCLRCAVSWRGAAARRSMRAWPGEGVGAACAWWLAARTQLDGKLAQRSRMAIL